MTISCLEGLRHRFGQTGFRCDNCAGFQGRPAIPLRDVRGRAVQRPEPTLLGHRQRQSRCEQSRVGNHRTHYGNGSSAWRWVGGADLPIVGPLAALVTFSLGALVAVMLLRWHLGRDWVDTITAILVISAVVLEPCRVAAEHPGAARLDRAWAGVVTALVMGSQAMIAGAADRSARDLIERTPAGATVGVAPEIRPEFETRSSDGRTGSAEAVGAVTRAAAHPNAAHSTRTLIRHGRDMATVLTISLRIFELCTGRRTPTCRQTVAWNQADRLSAV